MRHWDDVVTALIILRWVSLALALLVFFLYALYLIFGSLFAAEMLRDLLPKFLAKNDLIKGVLDSLKTK